MSQVVTSCLQIYIKAGHPCFVILVINIKNARKKRPSFKNECIYIGQTHVVIGFWSIHSCQDEYDIFTRVLCRRLPGHKYVPGNLA